jgi:hypothetical protein
MNMEPFRKRFILQEGDHLNSVVEETLAWIDSVHRSPDFPQTPLLFTSALHSYARYIPADGSPHHIELSRLSPYPHLSLTHEIGHLLDHALGNFDVYCSKEEHGPLASVIQAMERSAAIQSLHNLIAKPRMVEQDVNLHQLRYWLEPEEQWARAYAQYIALRSNSALMQAELRSLRESEIVAAYKNKQWATYDFEPIAAAVDRTFARLGWR